MKLILTAVLLFGLCPLSFAQKGLPSFGKIEKADLEMKDCDFDMGAEAFKLIDWCSLNYDRSISGNTLFKTVYDHRVRIKILKEKGLSYANLSIPFFSRDNDERIQKIDAYTYNIDEAGNIRTTDVGKSSIYTKRINKNYSELIIAFPEVKVGSVIEYRYKKETDRWQHIDDWYFQGSIPVRYSEYQIKIPLALRFTEHPSVVDKVDTQEDVFNDALAIENGVYSVPTLRKNYVMHNLVGIRNESFMGAAKDYQQRLEFQLSQFDHGSGYIEDLRTKWSDVIQHELTGEEAFGLQLEKTIPGTEDMVRQAKNLPDTESKITLIYNYVRKNMSWDGSEYIYSFNGINKAFEKRTGSNADINLLLIDLLKQAGIKALPILFSTRENGLVNTYYPSLEQFNSVMAYVPIHDKYYILDATDKISSHKLVPATVVNTRGFLLADENGKWIDVVETKDKFKIMAAVRGEIDASGTMKGEGMVNSSGYAKKSRSESWMKDKENFKLVYFTQPNTSLKIEDLTVNNLETDSLPLEQKVKFISTLNSSGDYRYFTVNLFSGLEKNPFIADERQTDVDFGYLQEYMIFGNYTIPEGYAFSELPENISLVMPDNSIVFNRFLQAEDNLLNVRITLEFKSSFYTAATYPDFKEFYKKLFAKLNEQIVIKKK